MVALILLAALPVRTAETVPPGQAALHVAGGLIAIDIDVPVAPPLPVFTAEVEASFGVLDGLDVRARYATQLGLVHHVGPEVRGRLWRGGGWSVGARLRPTFEFGGAWQEGVDYGGEVATTGAALLTWRGGSGALTLDAGVEVEWLVFEEVDGERFADDSPFLAFYELALDYEHPLYDDANLSARFEYARPFQPDAYPATVLGGFPRLLVGGSFAL